MTGMVIGGANKDEILDAFDGREHILLAVFQHANTSDTPAVFCIS